MSDYARDYEDPLADVLPPLVLDRQRIVQSAAFRRLQLKTQVFVAPTSDHFRTRLTHTLEVAHQARCLALVLDADAALAEVVALAHDLGHPPFGHAGERALDECLREHGGFEHNEHTLRVVEVLEHPYPQFPGLNLTRIVRSCLRQHATPYDRAGGNHPPGRDVAAAPPLRESRIVALADRLTYALHDLVDGLYAGLLDLAALQGVRLWGQCYAGPPADDGWRGHVRSATERMQCCVLEDLARNQPADAALSPPLEGALRELEAVLGARVYRSSSLQAADGHARQILTELFGALVLDVDRLPARFRRRLGTQPVERVVADYIAGMTDRFCLEEHARLMDG